MVLAAAPGLWHRLRACGWRFLLLRTLLLAAGWWILAEGRPSLAFGLPVVLAALLASAALQPPPPPTWRVRGLLGFVVVFVAGSVRGGVDVAWRAFAPRMPIEPGVQVYALRLPEGAARNLFLAAMSLMPGTLCLGVEGARADVHVLADHRGDAARDLDKLERAVARALGVPLEGDHA